MTRLPPEELMVEYVLGELPRADAEAFERSMASDAALAAEVQRLRNTLDLMPFAAVTEPPPELRGKVLQAAERQSRSVPAAKPARPARRIVWSRFAAAAAAAIAIGFGIDSYRVRTELALQREVTAMLQEPNVVRSFALAGTGSAGSSFGNVSLDLDAKKGAVAFRHLPALPADQVYRLWARVGDKSVPCGDFTAAADGTIRAQFRVPVESYTAPIANLFVTVEAKTATGPPSGPTVMTSA